MTPPTSNHDDSIAEQAAAWCMRFHEEDCTEDEKEALDVWVKSDQRHEIEYNKILKIWNLSTQLTPSNSIAHFQPTDNVTPIRSKQNQRQSPNWHLLGRVACLIMFLLPITGYIGWSQEWIPSNYQSYTAEQALKQITLPDGSHVELNLNTQLSYANYRHHRQVYLNHGEAYFNVAHDKLHPFVVAAASGEITVTGTRFNVWKYQDNVTIAVTEGSVIVRNGQAKSNLTPGLQASFNAAFPHPRTKKIDTEQALSWRNGQLIFNNQTLAEAVPQINRYLDTPLILTGPLVSKLRIGGIYRTDDIQTLVDTLPKILPVNLSKQQDGSIEVSGRY